MIEMRKCFISEHLVPGFFLGGFSGTPGTIFKAAFWGTGAGIGGKSVRTVMVSEASFATWAEGDAGSGVECGGDDKLALDERLTPTS